MDVNTVELTRRWSLSTWEGWREHAERPARSRPDQLTRSERARLGEDAATQYDRQRREWHANLVLRTRQVESLHLELGDIVDANAHDPGSIRTAAAIDAAPTLGKSTVLTSFGREIHRLRLRESGEYVDADHTIRHIPVCHVTLTGKPTIKGLHDALLTFYAHPSSESRPRGTAGRDLAQAAAECVSRHATRLILIDDLHFLNMRTKDGVEVSNQLKWLANEYDATFIFAGVGLRERGLLAEGLSSADAAMAQTFRRWTVLGMTSYSLRTKMGRAEWSRLISALDRAVVLADANEGMLSELSRYLYTRTGGNIGSLMSLIRRAASRAIRTGGERIDKAVLDGIRLDEGAEVDRARLERLYLHGHAAT